MTRSQRSYSPLPLSTLLIIQEMHVKRGTAIINFIIMIKQNSRRYIETTPLPNVSLCIWGPYSQISCQGIVQTSQDSFRRHKLHLNTTRVLWDGIRCLLLCTTTIIIRADFTHSDGCAHQNSVSVNHYHTNGAHHGVLSTKKKASFRKLSLKTNK